jgi:predicted PurR-regulated permease PerM
VRYFWTFFWAFVLVQMLSYVVSSMTEGGVFDFMSGAIISVGVFILIVIATTVLPNEPVEKH